MQTILLRAAGAMVFSYFVVGLGVGALIQRTIDAHIHDYKTRHPIPSNNLISDADSDGAAVADDPSNPGHAPITQASA